MRTPSESRLYTHKHPYNSDSQDLALPVGFRWLWLSLRPFAGSRLLLPQCLLFLLLLLSDRSKGSLDVPLLRGVLRRYGLPQACA
jgi:hypothetical protein